MAACSFKMGSMDYKEEPSPSFLAVSLPVGEVAERRNLPGFAGTNP